MIEQDRTGCLADTFGRAPALYRPLLANERFADWRAGLAPGHALCAVADKPRVAALLAALADHSPYLWRLATKDPDRLLRLLLAPPEAALAQCLDRMQADTNVVAAAADAMPILRRAKAETALLVAMADLGGVWDLDRVVDALTRFADRAVSAALLALLRDAAKTGKLLARDRDRGSACGMAILMLGKGGSRELNYSSDIDLVVLYDPLSSALAPGVVPAPFYVRITQALVRLLGERTSDGYVLRVDLRLRPDPGSTAIAISVPAAFVYYETLGQTWERAAFIKARPVAGDLALGATFLRELAPFIWRKYFDYAAIADVHAMKRQIHVMRGYADVAVPGHDIKLGRGGIREIEFFVQTQQLIFGGRRPSLRGAATLDMLAELEADGWIDEVAVSELTAAYRTLRRIEHRLQMIADEQTQRLPVKADALTQFALFAGYDDYAGLEADLLAKMRAVEAHYARLFEQAPGLDAAAGHLVFSGEAIDTRTVEIFRGLGFSKPSEAVETVRGWHFGRRPAVQGPPRPRSPDGARPGVAVRLLGLRRSRRGPERVRCRARPHAGGHRAFQHPEVECGLAPTLRRYTRCGTAARCDGHEPSPSSRCRDRSRRKQHDARRHRGAHNVIGAGCPEPGRRSKQNRRDARSGTRRRSRGAVPHRAAPIGRVRGAGSCG